MSATVARWTWCLRRSFSLARGFFFSSPPNGTPCEREGQFDPRPRRGLQLGEDAIAIEGDDGLARADLHVAARACGPRSRTASKMGRRVALGPAYCSSTYLLGLLEIDLGVAVPGVLVRGVIDDVPGGVGAEAVFVLEEGDALLAPVDAGVVDELGPLVERAAGLGGQFIGPLRASSRRRGGRRNGASRRAWPWPWRDSKKKGWANAHPGPRRGIDPSQRHMMGGGGVGLQLGAQVGAGGVGSGAGVHEGVGDGRGGRLGRRGAAPASSWPGLFLAAGLSSWRSPCSRRTRSSSCRASSWPSWPSCLPVSSWRPTSSSWRFSSWPLRRLRAGRRDRPNRPLETRVLEVKIVGRVHHRQANQSNLSVLPALSARGYGRTRPVRHQHDTAIVPRHPENRQNPSGSSILPPPRPIPFLTVCREVSGMRWKSVAIAGALWPAAAGCNIAYNAARNIINEPHVVWTQHAIEHDLRKEARAVWETSRLRVPRTRRLRGIPRRFHRRLRRLPRPRRERQPAGRAPREIHATQGVLHRERAVSREGVFSRFQDRAGGRHRHRQAAVPDRPGPVAPGAHRTARLHPGAGVRGHSAPHDPTPAARRRGTDGRSGRRCARVVVPRDPAAFRTAAHAKPAGASAKSSPPAGFDPVSKPLFVSVSHQSDPGIPARAAVDPELRPPDTAPLPLPPRTRPSGPEAWGELPAIPPAAPAQPCRRPSCRRRSIGRRRA